MTSRTDLLRTVKDNGPTRYYAGGQRVSKERYNEIYDSASRLDTMTTTRKDDAWHHRTCAVVA